MSQTLYADEKLINSNEIQVGGFSGNVEISNKGNLTLTYDYDPEIEEITLEKLGGAKKDHTHTLSSLGAASRDHTHTLKELGAAKEDHGHEIDDINGLQDQLDKLIETNIDIEIDPFKDEIASTMTPSTVMSPSMQTRQVILNNRSVERITDYPYETSTHSLPTSRALYDAITKLAIDIEAIDPNHNFLQDNAVITQALLPITFSTDSNHEWEYSNWILVDGELKYTNNGIDNVIRIPTSANTTTGAYFLSINITRLDSGALSVIDTKGHILASFTTPGVKYVQVKLENPSAESITIVAERTYPSEVISISGISYYKVTDRFIEYLEYFKDKLQSETPDAAVTVAMLNNALDTLHSELSKEIEANNDDIVDIIYNAVDAHASIIGNPHGTTYEDVGAAPATHTHTPVSIGAADRSHKHVYNDLSGVAEEFHTHDPKDIGAAYIEHQHGYEDVSGVAPEIHTHTLEELGAASALHTHSQYITNETVSGAVSDALGNMGVTFNSLVPTLTLLGASEGVLPVHLEGSSLSSPVVPILLPDIEHFANNNYDYYEGLISSNKNTVDNHPIEYAFKAIHNKEDYDKRIAVFESLTTTLDPEVLIEYKFNAYRTISGITLENHKDICSGIPVEIEIYADNILVSTITNDTWIDNSELVIPFESDVNLERLSIVVKRVSLDENNRWGIRVRCAFSDVESDHIALNGVVNYIVNGKIEDITAETSYDVSELVPNEIAYVTLNRTYISGDEDLNIPGQNLFALSTSYVPIEFGTKQRGYPVMYDRYQDSNTNAVWGTISTSDENPVNEPNVIYQDSDISYISNENEVTITHEFIDTVKLKGYKLLFSKEALENNEIPTSWTLTATIETIDEEGLVYTLEEDISIVEKYLPNTNSASTQLGYVKFDLESTEVTKLTLKLKNTKGNKISILAFVPYLAGEFYNILTNEASDPYLIPLGMICAHEYEGKRSYQYYPPAVGKSCIVPIDNLKLQPYGEVTHKVYNPFNTRNVDCTIMTSPTGETNYTGDASIEFISHDFITVKTKSPSIYCLKIVRNW